MNRFALAALFSLALLSGCAAPAWNLGGRDDIQIADAPWTFGAPQNAGFGQHIVAINQRLEQLGVTSGGTFTGGGTEGGTGSLSLSLGDNAVSSGDEVVVLGESASGTSDFSVAVGKSASVNTTTTEDRMVAIGAYTVVTGDQTTLVGQGGSGSGSDSSGFGFAVIMSGDFAAGVGADSQITADSGSALGEGTRVAHVGSMALGRDAATTAAAQLVAGADGFGITDVYVGQGVTDAAPDATVTWHVTGGSGTDVAGSDWVAGAGLGTGAGSPGEFRVETGTTAGSSSTLQTAATRLTVNESAATFEVPISATGANIFGATGVTTTFPGSASASILNGLVRAANVDGATNNFAINDSTSTIGVRVSGLFAWAAGNSASGAKDAGLSRISSGVVATGNGTAADASGTLSLAALGARAATTDTATVDLVATAMDAWEQATGGQDTGSDLILAGGLGVHSTEVVDFSQTGYTVTVTVNGTAKVLTEGSASPDGWTNVTSNSVSATALAVEISLISGVTATAVAAVVHITADTTVYSLLLAETGTGNTVTNNADGSVVFPGTTNSVTILDGVIGLASDAFIERTAASRFVFSNGGDGVADGQLRAATFNAMNGATIDVLIDQNGVRCGITEAFTFTAGAGNAVADTWIDRGGAAGTVDINVSDNGGGDGTLRLAEIKTGTSANGAFVSIKSASESFVAISTATLTTSSLVPAGARLLYVVGLVDTTISGGGVTSADWGDGTDVDRYNLGTTTAQLTAGDTIDATDATADPESWSTGTQDVTVTFVGGTPTAGALTVTVFYTLPTAGS